MDIQLEPGTYVVAVSGGVDSVVLLHALVTRPDLKLTVAHFDHGIRPDSHDDRLFVQALAKKYGVPFVYDEGNLGKRASEAQARNARYAFLRKAMQATGAQAIVTAHHRDDAMETAVINLIRGTGRKGLSSLRSVDGIKRPLLRHAKADILAYAREHHLEWHEDSTNADTAYLRNHVRHTLLPRVHIREKAEFQDILAAAEKTNQAVDMALQAFLAASETDGKLRRYSFIMLPHAVAREVMAAWLREHGVSNFDKSMLERTTHAAKIYSAGRKVAVTGSVQLIVGKDNLALVSEER